MVTTMVMDFNLTNNITITTAVVVIMPMAADINPMVADITNI